MTDVTSCKIPIIKHIDQCIYYQEGYNSGNLVFIRMVYHLVLTKQRLYITNKFAQVGGN